MMTPRQWILFIILSAGILLGWNVVRDRIWIPKPRPPYQEAVVAVAGGGAFANPATEGLPRRVAKLDTGDAAKKDEAKKDEAKAPPEEKKAPVIPVVPAKVVPGEPAELIALGQGSGEADDDMPIRLLITTRGAGVQQIVLKDFQEADREGLPVFGPDGKPFPLHLVPGVRWPRTLSLRGQRDYAMPVLEPGIVTPAVDELLAEPSYVMYHYEKPGDERPLEALGLAVWKVVERPSPGQAGEQKLVLETTLPEPYFVKIRKTFTLKPREYHIGLRVDIEPTNAADGAKKPAPFRYQISGAHALPIEGEWYTATFRTAMIGTVEGNGALSRLTEDAASIRYTEGGKRLTTSGRTFQYAGATVQYFASLLVVDNEQPERTGAKESGSPDLIEFVRTTPVGPPHVGKPFLDDLTVRTITRAWDVDKPLSHQFLLYQGPLKVRLLKQLRGERKVEDGLVDRYLDKLHLNTLTDAPMQNFLGRFANTIFWTDIVVTFTNLIHSLLYQLSLVIPSLGLCIMAVTLIVRGCLFPLSRRQAINGQVMQAKMARLAPEIKKLQEKYGDDFQAMNSAKTKLMLENGVNPLSTLGGCFLLLLQMPIFMGLYYALQESIFFRLEPFLWMPNLAAPDMLFRWGERIPYLSTPDDLGGVFYLGPFFNILPIVAVCLMMYQQKKMMPPAMDEQQAQQQKVMKYMMVLFGFMFYKVAAGLCIYFICSTLWGLTERQFLPKPKVALAEANAESSSGTVRRNSGKKGVKEKPPEKSKFATWWEKILDDAKKKN